MIFSAYFSGHAFRDRGHDNVFFCMKSQGNNITREALMVQYHNAAPLLVVLGICMIHRVMAI